MGKSVRVKKGDEVFEIEPKDLQFAIQDGYMPEERIIVANPKTKESFEIDPSDFPYAVQDGFEFSDLAKKKIESSKDIPTVAPLSQTPTQKPAKSPEELMERLGLSQKKSYPSELTSQSVLELVEKVHNSERDQQKKDRLVIGAEGMKSVYENNEIARQLEAAGYNPKEIIEDFKGVPSYSNLDVNKALEVKKENPYFFKRLVAANTWGPILRKNIKDKGESAQPIFLKIKEQQNKNNRSREEVRESMKYVIGLAKQYVDDPKERQKVIESIVNDKKIGYGLLSDVSIEKLQNDERYLLADANIYHINALQFLEDTDPTQAAIYNKYLSVIPVMNEDAKLGRDIKLRELETIGLMLQKEALEERLKDYNNRHEKGEEFTDEEVSEYQKLYSQYETLEQDILKQAERYPRATAVDADMLMQEALGQKNSAVKRALLGVGEEVDDAVNWIGDLLSSPFLSEEEKTMSDLEDLGKKKFTKNVMRYTIGENRLVKPEMIPAFGYNLKKQIDEVKASDLSNEEKQNKIRNLIVQNPADVAFIPSADGGKFNPTAKAWANTVSDVGSQIFSQVALGYLTGGAGMASKIGQAKRLFSTVFATAYNDYYVEALEKNIPNPTTYATTHTLIEASTELINNDLTTLKKMFNPQSSAGKIIKNLTKEEFEQIAKSGKGRFLEALKRTGIGSAKNAIGETKEELAGQLSGNIANQQLFGEDADLSEGVKETVINTFLGTLPLGLLGFGGQIQQANRSQKYALYEAAQNKEKYLPQLDKMVEDGVMTEEKAVKIKAIINQASEKLGTLEAQEEDGTIKSDNQKAEALAKEMGLAEDADVQKAKEEEIEAVQPEQQEETTQQQTVQQSEQQPTDEVEKINNAVTMVQGMVQNGQIPESYIQMAAQDPEGFLGEVYEQAQNTDTRQSAIDQFTEPLVQTAEEVYPLIQKNKQHETEQKRQERGQVLTPEPKTQTEQEVEIPFAQSPVQEESVISETVEQMPEGVQPNSMTEQQVQETPEAMQGETVVEQQQPATEEQTIPEPNTQTKQPEEQKPIVNKAGDPVRALAQKIRSGKINKLGGFKTSTGFDVVWDASLELVASALESGASVADAIESGLKYIRNTDWYKNLSNKEEFEQKYKDHFEAEYAETEDSEVSGIKKSLVSDEVLKSVNFDNLSDKEMMQMGRKIIDSGEVKPESLVNRIVKQGKGVLTPTEVVALITYKADLDNQLRESYKAKNERIDSGEDLGNLNQEIADLEDKILSYEIMSVITANQQSMAFRLRKKLLDRDYNVVDQIEKYKANNNGEIPADVEKKFRELGKELDEVKKKLAEAEEKLMNQEAQSALNNIVEDVERKKKLGISEEEIERMVQEGVQREIDEIHKKLPKAKKTAAQKAIDAIERMQARIRNKSYSDISGMTAIIDAGLTTIKNAIKAGVAVADAVEMGITKIKDLLRKQGVNSWAKENEFRKDMIEGFSQEGIPVSEKKQSSKGASEPYIDEDGKLKIPPRYIRGLVERGLTNIKDITEVTYKYVSQFVPNATRRQVRDAITEYGKTVNPTKDEIQQQINLAKRIGRLMSELEDLQKGIKKASGSRKIKLTEKERDYKRRINELKKQLPLTEQESLARLENQKERIRNRIRDLQDRINRGDFSRKKTEPLNVVDKEYVDLKAKEQEIKNEFDKAQYKNELKNRSTWQKIEDVILEVFSGLIRGLVAGVDFSYVFVQGLKRLVTSPKQSFKAFIHSIKSLGSEKYTKHFEAMIKSDPAFSKIKQAGLALTEVDGKHDVKEEMFLSNWINLIWNTLWKALTFGSKHSQKIADFTNLYRRTARAYNTYLNSIRIQGFIEMAKYLERRGLTIETDLQEFKKAADHINTATGRASLGVAETSSKWLNTFFFAPRKVVSELKLFTPYVFVYYARFPKYVRMKAIGDYLQFMSTLVASHALIWAARKDWDDEEEKDNFWNPFSSDFLTHKIGDNRVEVTGGLRTTVVFMSRLLSGKFTDAKGKTTKLGERFGKRVDSRGDLAVSFLANKLSPAPSYVWKKMDWRKGDDVDEIDELKNLAIPMWTQDLNDLYKENPTLVASGLTVLGIFGASVRVQDNSIRIPNKITADGKTVELKGEQLKEFQDIARNKITEYKLNLLDTDQYKEADKNEKEKLEEMVRDEGIKFAEEQMREKYPDLIPEKTREEKFEEKLKRKELKRLKAEIGIDVK